MEGKQLFCLQKNIIIIDNVLVFCSTFHRTFGLNINYRSTNPSDVIGKQIEKNLQGVDYFCFDEVSSLGCYLNGFISERLSALRDNPETYGNANIILTGKCK
jgi:hypothetical protein